MEAIDAEGACTARRAAGQRSHCLKCDRQRQVLTTRRGCVTHIWPLSAKPASSSICKAAAARQLPYINLEASCCWRAWRHMHASGKTPQQLTCEICVVLPLPVSPMMIVNGLLRTVSTILVAQALTGRSALGCGGAFITAGSSRPLSRSYDGSGTCMCWFIQAIACAGSYPTQP